MRGYIDGMLEEFPGTFKGNTKTPWTERLFKVSDDSLKLDIKKAALYHTFVMKLMFLAKRARSDIMPGVGFLSTRTSESN